MGNQPLPEAEITDLRAFPPQNNKSTKREA